jgi:hypothetical protein
MKFGGVLVMSLGIAVATLGAPARAEMVVSGPTSNAGSYSASELALFGASHTLYSFGGVTGVALWDLLGGGVPVAPNNPSTPNVSWGGISTSTPSGYATNNAILRDYVLATGTDGKRSVVSLGEIAPVFGAVPTGPNYVPAFVAFKTDGGTLLSSPQLVIPASSVRGVGALGSLELLSAPALPSGVRGTPSTAVELKGDVTNPDVYTRADLQGLTPTIDVTANGDKYTGIPLWDFLKPNTSNILDKLVVIKGTDGYQVVHALAELDPSKGGDPFILLAYADTGTDLNDPSVQGAGDIARTIIPKDTVRRGRWMSNVYEIDVISAPTPTPLPASWTMMLLGLAGLGATKLRRAKKSLVPAAAA